jgi:hypothetical protein
MKRAQMFHAARAAPSETSWGPNSYFSRFVSKAESLTPLWTGLRQKVLKFFRHICAVGPPTAQSHNDRARQHFNRSQVHGGQPEIEFLAEEIASLARHIEGQKQQRAIAVAEASLALHFRKTREQIVEALILPERQGRAKRIVPEGHRVFLF